MGVWTVLFETTVVLTILAVVAVMPALMGRPLIRDVKHEIKKSKRLASREQVNASQEKNTHLPHPTSGADGWEGMTRFEQLTLGVSGVSHLRAPYTEMLDLLKEKDRLSPDVVEHANQTIQDIEDAILEKWEQDMKDKAWRDNQHILMVRQSAGLR